jgi:hypothetical protein
MRQVTLHFLNLHFCIITFYFVVCICGLLFCRGWVLENSIAPYTDEATVGKFLPKKFKNDKDYRAAVVEATRIVLSTNNKRAAFGEEYFDLLRSCEEARTCHVVHYTIFC